MLLQHTSEFEGAILPIYLYLFPHVRVKKLTSSKLKRWFVKIFVNRNLLFELKNRVAAVLEIAPTNQILVYTKINSQNLLSVIRIVTSPTSVRLGDALSHNC